MRGGNRNGLREVNLEQGMPQVSEAVKRMRTELENSRKLGFAAVKLIHGYGSSGKGGKIRVASRMWLTDWKNAGLIQNFIPGETFSIFDENTLKAFRSCDELRADRDLERHNNGVTFVIL